MDQTTDVQYFISNSQRKGSRGVVRSWRKVLYTRSQIYNGIAVYVYLRFLLGQPKSKNDQITAKVSAKKLI